jgi:hypothetical protein
MTETQRRNWREVEPEEASKLTKEELDLIDRPANETGETCPWPWDPQQLEKAPLGRQYHCPYCGAMVIAGRPHIDYGEERPPPIVDFTA